MSKIKVDKIETLDGTKSFLVANLSDAALAVVDGLTSTDVGAALSANQGRVLKGLLDDTNTNVLGKQNTLVSGVNIKTAGGQSLLGAGDAPIVAPETHAATSKDTPADADELGLSDSAASWGLKKLTFANLKTWLTGLFVSRSADSTIITPSGQATLTIRGGTDRGNVVLSTGAADGSGVAAGTFGFVHEAATASSAEKRLALIGANTDGATAGHRGGKLSFSTKPNASASLVERMAIDNAGNVGIGKTPTTTLDVGGAAQVSYSAAGASGRAVISLVNEESGAALSIGANSSTHTDTTWGGTELADAAVLRAGGATSGGLALYTGTQHPITFWMNSVKRLAIDTSGNVLVTGGVLGYGVGSGGTVTQATSKSTAVTLNKPSGRVTMHDASLNASTAVTFQLQSSAITTSSTVSVTVLNPSIASAAVYRLEVLSNFAGGVFLRLTNTGGSALAEAVQFQFNVHAGSTS